MTWLDIGNGWRNIFLLSCALQAAALGVWFCLRGWFSPRHRVACFLTGVAATPLCQYLWMLLLALLWPQAPRWVYIGVPPALAVVGLAVMGLRRAKRLREEAARLWALTRSACRLDKPAVASLCFAVCMALLLLPFSVRLANSSSFLNGADSSARIVSRSVGKGSSKQVFHPKAIGNNQCHAHVQCDSIIMDNAEISSIPEINARHVDAQIIHEAAIGRINDEQLVKLRTFGMTEEEAESVIIESFLK